MRAQKPHRNPADSKPLQQRRHIFPVDHAGLARFPYRAPFPPVRLAAKFIIIIAPVNCHCDRSRNNQPTLPRKP